MPRIHPQLRALNEDTPIYSDHVLKKLTTPEKEGRKSLTVLSLNILSPDAFYSGFYLSPTCSATYEHHQRYDRTAKSLKKAVDAQDAEVIVLQDVTQGTAAKARLAPILGDQWQIVLSLYTNQITCYKTSRFDPLEQGYIDYTDRVHSLALQDKANGNIIYIHNVRGHFNPFPDYTERLYRPLLVRNDNAASIVDHNPSYAAP